MDDKNTIEQSLCTKSPDEAEQFLAYKAALQCQDQKNSNKKKKLHFLQLQSVLRELLVRKIMPFTEVFQHYCSGIRSIQSYTYEEKN